MEVSSHGIAQGRIEGLTFHTAIFTNLTRDHLDYHGDMRSYAAEKAKLFAHAELQYGVFNADDVYSTAMKAKANGRALWYRLGGRPEDDVLCGAVAGSEGEGITLEIDGPYGKAQLNSPLIGRFNAYNLLASVAGLLTLDISLDDACLALGQVKPAPGRMQWLGGQDKPVVVVDYCHTPDSLRSALSALRPVTARALWCVFGCGGDRDPGKRPEMGAIAVAGSDYAVLTDDNPRSEASQDIIDDVLEGIEDEKDVVVLSDRGAAIEHAIKNAVVGYVILIAGKGHETYQERDGVRHPFSDVAAARNVISSSCGLSPGASAMSGLWMRVSDAATRIGAQVGRSDGEFSGVTIDSRRIEPGNLFVALSGERVDGHDFVGAAEAAGAGAALVERAVDTSIPTMTVADSELGLGALARAWRENFSIPRWHYRQ